MSLIYVQRDPGEDRAEVSVENPMPVSVDGGVTVASPVPVYLKAESITVSTTAIPLTNVPPTATQAIVSVEADQVRYWVDASTPTASVGHRLNVDDVVVLVNREEVLNFRTIRVTADATLRVSYLR